MYSTFGHSAIQIADPGSGIDKVYNYGTFDFDTPNFYLKFARGKLEYILSVSNFERFVRSYHYEGRWVVRQEINLNQDRRQELFNLLEENAKAENRAYKYDFLYDNCSTRIRDIIEKTLGEELDYEEEIQKPDTTFRNFLDLYLTNHPWSDLGIDIALGAPCDKVASPREKMFLPDYLMSGLSSAVISNEHGTKPLLLPEQVILEENTNLIKRDEESISWMFWLLFTLIALISFFAGARRLIWFDRVYFFTLGVIGVLLFLLWFATDHTATKWNYNLLWALPTWIVAPFLLNKNSAHGFFKTHAILMFALIVFWMLIPQNLHAITVPLILIAAMRSWAWNKHHFNRKKSIS